MGQIYKLFSELQKKTVFLDSTVKCELRVYGQGNRESERITRICFARN